jgi:hypothetical protein
MEYIIRNFNVKFGQITVEYAGKWTYAIDLPVENGAFPVGEKLEAIIQNMAPTWVAEREKSLEITPANAEQIQALVQPKVVTEGADFNYQNLATQEQLDSDKAFIAEIVTEILQQKGL